MKNYSLKPTDENALELLRKDPIGRVPHVLRFMKLLSYMEDDCYSIALNGEWGSGKSFFIKQLKLILDAYNPQSQLDEDLRKDVEKLRQPSFAYPTNYTTVYYDAWSNDNHIDPILSLIFYTINSSQSDFPVERKRSIGNAAAAIAETITGRSISDTLKALRGTDQLESVKDAESLKDLVKDFLNALIVEHGDRLIFFIDELDRCKPDYAIRLLERIKHFFDDERVSFVFAVNLSQLACTVKSYYGSEFNATRYLDKFFDMQISLPHVNYDRFLENRLGVDGSEVIDMVCIETAKYFDFSLREAERYIRLYKIARKAANSIASGFSEQNAIVFSVMYFVPIMLGLQMSDMGAFSKFILGKDYGPMLDILLRPNIRIHIPWLTNNDEKYNETTNTFEKGDGTSVSLSNRLKDTYTALFTKSHKDVYRESRIGGLSFSEDTRKIVEEIAALLSPHSDYEFK